VRCYFSAQTNLNEGSENGLSSQKRDKRLISFAIPDLGILFRAQYIGTSLESGYVSLLVLLRFIEKNPLIFENQNIDIYTHIPLIVYQVNKKIFCDKNNLPLKEMALFYRKKFFYNISWIPEKENNALRGLLDFPPLDFGLKLDFEDLKEGFNTEGSITEDLSHLSF